MSTWFSKIIRLAYSETGLREHLLPILKDANTQVGIEGLLKLSIKEIQEMAKDPKVRDQILSAVAEASNQMAADTAKALKIEEGKVTSTNNKWGGTVFVNKLRLGSHTYGLMLDTKPDLKSGKYKSDLKVTIGVGSNTPIKSVVKKTWSKPPSGMDVANWVTKNVGKAKDKVRKYWK